MKPFSIRTLRIRAIAVCFLSSWIVISHGESVTTEICIYGGTAGGVAAAVEAARLGKKAVLIEPGKHLGGMSSGGLSQTDIGNKAAIGGISREFYQRMGRHYGKEEQWSFEPSVAEGIFQQFIEESAVLVHYQGRLRSVTKKDGRIFSIKTEDGTVFKALMFIDASYEGDLMAKAGVSYTVGREANATYGETLNGIRGQTPKHQFTVDVDPFTVPKDSKSGLMPLVQPIDFGTVGGGDRSVQAYNFRMCLTQNPTNQIPIGVPDDYNPATYELLARYIAALSAAGKTPHLSDLMHIQPMPNGKTDINNNGAFSTDFIGANYDYPDGSYEVRAKIWKAHEDYTRGFFHFLATDPRLPESLRREMQRWGLCRDEFTDNGGWPYQLYVREARRMISDYVMTEKNCRESLPLPDAVGLAAYTMDSHNCRRIVRNGLVENEGDTQIGGFPPYPIAYRAIVPKASECVNLFVTACLSASHIAYGSIRMEPVFMVLGQSASAAACLCIDEKVEVQMLNMESLKKRLIAEKQILEWHSENQKL